MRPLKFGVVFLFFFLLCSSLRVFAQRGPDIQDLSNVRVDELTDAQVRAIQVQIEQNGLGGDLLEQAVAARGMSSDEIQKLKRRLASVKEAPNADRPRKNPKSRRQTERGVLPEADEENRQPASTADNAQSSTDSVASRIFGASLFANARPSFEPDLRLATPMDYQIGPDDEILIDIYGYSEASYELTVSPDGTINVPMAGVIAVSGITMEEATNRIRQRLSAIYAGINNGTTRVSITLGNIRSIRVIITGEVKAPGAYTLPSVATLFNALYACGGPAENGSFRAIQLIRGGKVVSTLDIYDFLLFGSLKNNTRLQDQDVLRVPTYVNRVEITGAVKHPGIFETKNQERLTDLLAFAGGFNERAYRARIKVLRNTPTERAIQDITAEQFDQFKPESGDQFFVNNILERFTNRVSINGAVFRGGQYELESGLTLKGLIQKAEGLREDAFLNRGYITRLKPDLSSELISFDVAGVMRGQEADIALKREDVVTISSVFDLRENYSLTIDGEVRKPGTFPYAEQTSIEELIMQAGGFTERATPKRIEVSRRIRNRQSTKDTTTTAQVFVINADEELSEGSTKFQLEPFDMVIVRSAPGYEKQRVVRIEGEVLYPGLYSITNKNERISDLIRRAGGLTAFAYAEGASLKRTGLKITQTDQEKEQLKLRQFQALQRSIDDSVQVNVADETSRNDYVGIDLERILNRPRKRYDLLLEEGDVLNIPKQLQTVKVSGQVLSPSAVIYTPGESFKSYVRKSGGFAARALRRRSYVVYANGAIASTRKILMFNNYPEIRPGAEIYVPIKEERRNKLSPSEIIAITTGLTTIATLIFTILR